MDQLAPENPENMAASGSLLYADLGHRHMEYRRYFMEPGSPREP